MLKIVLLSIIACLSIGIIAVVARIIFIWVKEYCACFKNEHIPEKIDCHLSEDTINRIKNLKEIPYGG